MLSAVHAACWWECGQAQWALWRVAGLCGSGDKAAELYMCVVLLGVSVAKEVVGGSRCVLSWSVWSLQLSGGLRVRAQHWCGLNMPAYIGQLCA